jgi:hypothetical protein
MHKTQTIDYGIVLAGERELVLDDCRLVMKPGDIVVQVGAWHQWVFPKGAMMAFDMFAARFVDGPKGLGQGKDKPITTVPKLPQGVKPQRRIVTIDQEPGIGTLVCDGPAPDVRADPARPGFASARLWVTDAHPAAIVFETLQLPHTLEPPKNGSVCRVVTVPPDAAWKGKVGAKEVQAYFRDMGSPAPRPTPAGTPPLHAEDAHAGVRHRPRRRDRARARHAGSGAEGRRHRHSARHEPRLEQSIGEACRRGHRVARWQGMSCAVTTHAPLVTTHAICW